MALRIESNVKLITSGHSPIVWNGSTGLKNGEMAFGFITAGDGNCHLFGNANGKIVDFTSGIVPTLDEVLAKGNTSSHSIRLEHDSEDISSYVNIDSSAITVHDKVTNNELYLSRDSVKLLSSGGKITAEMSAARGFIDGDYKVLSSNPDASRDLSPGEQLTIRNRINVLSKTEVEEKIANINLENYYTKPQVDELLDEIKQQLNEHIKSVVAHPDMNVSDTQFEAETF